MGYTMLQKRYMDTEMASDSCAPPLPCPPLRSSLIPEMTFANLKLPALLCSLVLSATAAKVSLAQTTTPAQLPDAPSTTAHDAPPAEPTGPTVVFDTTMGRLTCKLYDKEAPATVANFIGLATGTKPWTDPTTQKKVTGKPFY